MKSGQPSEALSYHLDFNTFKFEATWEKALTGEMQTCKVITGFFRSHSYT